MWRPEFPQLKHWESRQCQPRTCLRPVSAPPTVSVHRHDLHDSIDGQLSAARQYEAAVKCRDTAKQTAQPCFRLPCFRLSALSVVSSLPHGKPSCKLVKTYECQTQQQRQERWWRHGVQSPGVVPARAWGVTGTVLRGVIPPKSPVPISGFSPPMSGVCVLLNFCARHVATCICFKHKNAYLTAARHA